MAYTALEAMRRVNAARYGKDLGPMQPSLYCTPDAPFDLKSAALRFLHERCEELGFDPETAALEADGTYRGRSIKPGQIPCNMEKDIDRLCLEKALEAFIGSGTAEDAYTVYYSYLHMFFGRYGASKKMVELLSEYESNGSSLLMKHRDHYSHSVYVFALGLAIYECSDVFRRSFERYYAGALGEGGEHEGKSAANLFLEFWGLASLFHDIGYPFELPFEQVLSYFEVDNQERGEGSLYLAYRSVESLTALDPEAQKRFQDLYGRRFSTIIELLAFDLTKKLGVPYDVDEQSLLGVLNDKPVAPEKSGYFMDHAYFSAARLYGELADAMGAGRLTPQHVDALSAILLHNSLFKFAIAFYKSETKHKAPLRMDLHPLAFLLMLCDELQCWDRTAYGRNSRTELHPMSADFDFRDGGIAAVYYYDAEEREKIGEYKEKYRAWEAGGEQGKPPRLKAYSDMAEKEQRFTKDILKIVDLSEMPLNVVSDVRPVDRRVKHTYLSESNFLHLYDFAVAINGRGAPTDTKVEELEKTFESLSLEYQISNINRAKNFDRYLNALGCFYTDKPVDFPMVTYIGPEDAAVIAPMEHERWVREHIAMGWRYGTEYTSQDMREQIRMHKLAMDGDPTTEEIRAHFLSLSPEDQDKDWKPFNDLLKLLKKFDGLRIYRLKTEEYEFPIDG